MAGACFALTAMAQVKHSPRVLGKNFGTREGVVASPVVPGDANRDVIWTNDFSDCSDWTIVNANDAGNDEFIAGINFECGVNPPEGPASIDEIASPTASNGYMCVDSDEFGGTLGGDWIENCWFQTADPIDVTGYDYVSLQFYTQYYMWDSGTSDGNEYCLVEISTDGVTWPDISTYEVSEAPAGTRFELWPYMLTQDLVDNPTLKIFDLSGGIPDGATQLWLRFRWKGTWGYAWMVDDIEVFETPESDLTVLDVYNGNFVEDWEYTKIPTSQVTDMTFGAVLANYGYTDQSGTNVDVAITGPGNYNISTSVNISASDIDTVWAAPTNIGNAVGTYTLTVTVPEDDLSIGNSNSKDFEITDVIYAHNTDTDLVQRGFDIDDEVAIGCFYVVNANAETGGIQVLFGSNTTEDLEVVAYIYETPFDDVDGWDDANNEFLAQSAPMIITSSMIGSLEYVVIPFEDAVTLEAGKGYTVEVRKEESGDRLYILSSVKDEDFATVNFGPFNDDVGETWYRSWNWSPSVQMILDPTIAVNEVVSLGNIELLQNSPNPATSFTNISYNLTNASKVTLTVRDMTGRNVKVVNEGMKSSGKQTINLNVSDLSAGVYTYTLTDGTSSITKEMIIR